MSVDSLKWWVHTKKIWDRLNVTRDSTSFNAQLTQHSTSLNNQNPSTFNIIQHSNSLNTSHHSTSLNTQHHSTLYFNQYSTSLNTQHHSKLKITLLNTQHTISLNTQLYSILNISQHSTSLKTQHHSTLFMMPHLGSTFDFQLFLWLSNTRNLVSWVF